ncbi:OTU domain-containing protein [Mycena indigotica]|uniref:OTU domain-containing protein n=1 Tax=Mycena indigotica TaxID=2126181 RepID=A0A8H6SA46_9AGAR|nr:OTU domain-containing protein [Mycena indigotica]KAF7294975.1 OTU domain-containing protein [Mycena indigotica]
MAKKKSKKSQQPLADAPPAIDDDELVDDLFAQLDSRDAAAKQESAELLNEMQSAKIEAEDTKQDSKARFNARQARKAAALAETFSATDSAAEARLEKEAKDEEKDINRVCDELNVKIHEISPDGHCLFSAVADQLQLLSILPSAQATYAITRATAAAYMYAHPDDFIPFLPSAHDDGGETAFMSPREFQGYCASIRDTAIWGGEPEILALCRAYKVPIHVIQGGRPPIVVHNPSTEEPGKDQPVVRISYHRRMYGLGEVSFLCSDPMTY